MNVSSKNKIEAGFSMASMTDLIFLLLVFFMLTSSFVTPSGVPVNLPTTKASTIEVQKVSVTVTKSLQYYVNEKKVSKAMLEGELKSRLGGPGGSVVLHIDTDVPWGEAMYVTGIATSLEAKVIAATKPK
ncbi:MAG: biopolymer transporter ExbD [Cyclobacteriaceae bacterium]|nr:biopolymer transporter ExbD [Cyclobacteriaceae bacterium]